MIRCLDAGLVIKWLTPKPGSPSARAVCLSCLEPDVRWVAPPFFWAEVGSVLRKQVRTADVAPEEAALAWDRLLELPIRPVQGARLWHRAWSWAERAGQPTLYDACYLAATEAASRPGVPSEFWTADRALVAGLGDHRPSWVRLLSEWPLPTATEE